MRSRSPNSRRSALRGLALGLLAGVILATLAGAFAATTFKKMTAGAVATAAFLGPLAGRDLGRQVVLVVSGGNIDSPLLERVVPRALLERRRLLTLRVALTDYPGSLGRLTNLLGEQGEVVSVLNDWKGRVISPTLPVIVAFGKFRAHFRTDELEPA